MIVNLTGDKTMLDKVLPTVNDFVNKLPSPTGKVDIQRETNIQMTEISDTLVHATYLIHRTQNVVNIHTCISGIGDATKGKGKLLSQWAEQSAQKLLPVRNEAFAMTSQVNYVVMGGKGKVH